MEGPDDVLHSLAVHKILHANHKSQAFAQCDHNFKFDNFYQIASCPGCALTCPWYVLDTIRHTAIEAILKFLWPGQYFHLSPVDCMALSVALAFCV